MQSSIHLFQGMDHVLDGQLYEEFNLGKKSPAYSVRAPNTKSIQEIIQEPIEVIPKEAIKYQQNVRDADNVSSPFFLS